MKSRLIQSKKEAVEGRNRITSNPESLAAQLRDNPTVEPPYTFTQISVISMQLEILRIHQNARKETKEIYNLGHDTERVEEENWIIRWMLWHVFRYRDNRNRNRRTISLHDASDDERSRGSASTTSVPTISTSTCQI